MKPPKGPIAVARFIMAKEDWEQVLHLDGPIAKKRENNMSEWNNAIEEMRNWRADGYYPGLLVHIRAIDNKRVGHCWMAGRLLDGDLAMIVSHSGDCFFNYVLLDHKFSTYNKNRVLAPGLKVMKGSDFGAYTLGQQCAAQPISKDLFRELMEGKMVTLEQPLQELAV
jgi:hypothetical protein